MITLFTVAFPQVSIKTREGFVFKGVVRPPDEIVSMRGGDFYADFVANISLESNPIKVGDQSNIIFKILEKLKVQSLQAELLYLYVVLFLF